MKRKVKSLVGNYKSKTIYNSLMMLSNMLVKNKSEVYP